MPSFEQRFYLQNATYLQRLKRNLRLIAWIFAGAWAYLWPGFAVRRAYRRAQQSGTPLSLEQQLSKQRDG